LIAISKEEQSLNLINFQNPLNKPSQTTEDTKYPWLPVKDFRKHDYNKILEIIENMYNNIKMIDENFDFKINFENQSSPYLHEGETHYKKLSIDQNFGDQSNTLGVLIPRLLYDNFFMLNGSVYVPLLFLEKSPIDRILNKEANKNKIFININAVYNFTFDFTKKIVQFRSKTISMDIFFRVFFKNDKDYLLYLQDLNLISKLTHTKEEYKKFIKSFFDFYKWEYFTDKNIAEWLDKYLILDYYREIFKDYYDIDNLSDIIKKVIDFYVEDEPIDMATLSNRRVVMIEYLIRPLFEVYVRLLYGIIDKKTQNFLPTVNEYVVMTSGFSGIMHRGQLYDISNPFASPLINKVSQSILIIKNNRLPKSWQRNDVTGFGVICPISVSPQNMASTLVFTNSAKINKLGRIKDNSDQIQILQ